jgi:hypothetical protein
MLAVTCLLSFSTAASAKNTPGVSAGPPKVVAARLGDTQVAPSSCHDAEHACRGLRRGEKLDVELSRAGYAVAFLQDGHGQFFNQEGRMFIRNLSRGDTKLWPGTSSKSEDEVFKLYVVSGSRPIVTHADSEPLPELPPGEVWGPVFLSMVTLAQVIMEPARKVPPDGTRLASATGGSGMTVPPNPPSSWLSSPVVIGSFVTGTAVVIAAIIQRKRKPETNRRQKARAAGV